MSFLTFTKRLILRDIQKGDIPTLLKRKIEPSARPNILFQKSEFVHDKTELKFHNAWSKVSQKRLFYQLIVNLKSDDSIIGTCGLWDTATDGTASIGWHYESKYARNGYATEVAQELLYIGFEINNCAAIYAESFTDNLASIRIMEKLGMSPDWSVGEFKRLNGNGVEKTGIRYKIFRKEWLILND